MTAPEKYKYLYRVNSPKQLKELSLDELPGYCNELRHFMVEQLANNSGHVASSLGAVELAVAIHYVYDTPDDKLIWDVGHQAYAHKIITGRRDAFESLRKKGGIGGFPRRSESPYDAFVGGHASVSISAALGMAEAAKLQGRDTKVVAVIGDGAMTGGLAFEGLNNAGVSGNDLLVILNDNRMAIDANSGAIRDYLLSISTSHHYNALKAKVWNAFPPGSHIHNAFKRIHNTFKQGIMQQSNLFESFKFRYFGPVDGNNIRSLVKVLRDLKEIGGPKLLHVITVKGKGYKPAERNQVLWHAPGKFIPETGELITSSSVHTAKFQEVFGRTLLDLARLEPRVVGVTPAMPTGCSMDILMEQMSERCFDVGIAEEHAVTFSAGLASEGMIPFCNIYSTFMQRAFDEIIHDVALQNLGVVLCLDRGGLVGEDGATHHGAFDLAYLGCIPNLTIAAPSDERELRNMMYTAMLAGTPFAIRYPRGCGVGAEWRDKPFEQLTIGRGRKISDGEGTAVLSIGTTCAEAAKGIDLAAQSAPRAAHYDMRFAKPLDTALLDEVARQYDHIITIEDGVLRGGVGAAIENYLTEHGFRGSVRRLGIDDMFVEHGTVAELRHECGFDAEAVAHAITARPE